MFLPLVITLSRSLCVLIQKGVRYQFQGSFRVGDNRLNSLQLFLQGVYGGVLSHDVSVIRGVWSADTRLKGQKVKERVTFGLKQTSDCMAFDCTRAVCLQ